MLKVRQILVSPRGRDGLRVCAAAALALLAACGQRGPLYLPTEPASANRATLPQTVTPASLGGKRDGDADADTPAPTPQGAASAPAGGTR